MAGSPQPGSPAVPLCADGREVNRLPPLRFGVQDLVKLADGLFPPTLREVVCAVELCVAPLRG